MGFRRNSIKRKKKSEIGKGSAFWVMGTKQALVPRKQNREINGSPGL